MVFAQYYIFEWFEKDIDKRIDSTNLQKPSFRDWDSECISVFVREMQKQIPRKYFVEKDDHGRFKAEEFSANNTFYYACAIMPKAPILKVLLVAFKNTYNGVLKRIRRNLKLLLLIGIFIFTVVAVIGSLEILKRLSVHAIEYAKEKTKQEVVNNKNKVTKLNSSASTAEKNDTAKIKPTEVEPKTLPVEPKKGKTDDELFREAKTISDFKALADKGYKKAYYPLAEKYYQMHDYNNASLWAKKSSSPSSKKILEAIEYVYKGNSQYLKWIGSFKQNEESRISAIYAYGYVNNGDPLISNRLKELKNE